ncbi:protein TolA, partial [Helicobacter pylori]
TKVSKTKRVQKKPPKKKESSKTKGSPLKRELQNKEFKTNGSNETPKKREFKKGVSQKA